MRPRTKEITALISQEHPWIHAMVGPRQVGKSTASRQIAQALGWEVVMESADSPIALGPEWIRVQWERAERLARKGGPCLLVLDEIQKVSGWSEMLKSLWDARGTSRIQVLILGSSAMHMQMGLSESLAGRFLLHRYGHWAFHEMRDAFGLDLSQWLHFGGYPGAIRLMDQEDLWRSYIRDSLVETALARDVLQMQAIRKPTLLRNLFALACLHPAQCLSYNKMLGALQDAGNTVTLAHYLQLLQSAWLVAGLEAWRPGLQSPRGSSPKLVVLNNALASSMSGRSRSALETDSIWRGRVSENAIAAHLFQALEGRNAQLHWWRDGALEVDLVVRSPKGLWAIEIKSGKPENPAGLREFMRRWPDAVPMIVGPGGIPFEEFLQADLPEMFWV
ncbi:MAG TPA: ATP-binding protein [Fibrobacteria bacterium]|nr:ATP-binding protein [Fibrobacteria bacterium]HOX50858.1 ATP-binding protein [Fibrobacteria bacterium]